MDQFREFLDTKGKALSQISEFLPFYAFPYVEKPKSHPVYKQLFDPNWKSDLKKKLLILLGPKEEEIYPLPKLFSLLNPPEEVSNNLEKQLQNRLADAERRAFQFHQRFNKIQEDYQSLIGITSDLVDTLEGVLRGEHVEPDALQKICCRLVASQRTTVNKNVALGNKENGVSNTSSKFSYCDTLRQSLSIRKPQENLGSKQEWGIVELDYKKINETLNGSNQTQIWRLLQALRWRLTKTNVELREAYLTEFIGHDLLDLTPWNGENRQKRHLSMLEHCFCEVSPKVTESGARLVNALASLSRGRAYLAQNTEVVTLLTQQIFHLEGDEESSTRENLIGALQKLSLRRSMQTKMTEMGMVEWLVNLLEDTDSLSDYTLEYSVALLMNLCLRMDGKKRCAPMASRVLKVLTDLINHENTNILSYVNGALFSLLMLPELQIAAEAMDLEGILSCYMREDQQELNRQFEYIIKQMHSNDQNVEEDGLDNDEDDDDDEDDDEEDTAQMEVDIDRGDDITDNKENTLDGSVIGEILLKERYEKEKENATPSASKRAGRSAMNSPLPPMPNKALSPQPPFGRHDIHSENDPIINNNAGLLRRPSTPSRRRNSNITPSQIPKPAGSTRQSVARKTPNRPSKVIEESHTKGRIGKTEHPDSPQMSGQKDLQSLSESKKRVVENHPEYQKAFNSRPKILRTPEHKVGQSEILNSSSKSRPGSGKN
nr:lisH domain containing protein ARMC9 [Hymenolepis microstoma]